MLCSKEAGCKACSVILEDVLLGIAKTGACCEARRNDAPSTGVTLPKDEATIAPISTVLAKFALGAALPFGCALSPSLDWLGEGVFFAPAGVA